MERAHTDMQWKDICAKTGKKTLAPPRPTRPEQRSRTVHVQAIRAAERKRLFYFTVHVKRG